MIFKTATSISELALQLAKAEEQYAIDKKQYKSSGEHLKAVRQELEDATK